MKTFCPKCSKGTLNYNLYGYPDISSVDMIQERFDITTNIKGCEPPLAGKKNYLYSCDSCNYETADIEEFECIELGFVIGGFSHGIQKIIWDGSLLSTYKSDRGYEDLHFDCSYHDYNLSELYIAEDTKWNNFWNIIDEINVWKWDKEYYNNTILDGTQWELLIKRKGRRKRRIFGSNNYPKEDDRLLRLQKAINNLIGDNFFIFYD